MDAQLKRRIVIACSAVLVAFALLGAVVYGVWAYLRDNPRTARIIRAMQGRPVMTDAEAAGFQERLQEHPDDLDIREQLAEYYDIKLLYGGPGPRDHALIVARRNNILWTVHNRPDAELLTGPFVVMHTEEDAVYDSDGEGYRTIRQAWLEAVARRPSDIAVLRNAASFFRYDRSADRSRAQEYLETAHRIAPSDIPTATLLAKVLTQKINAHAPEEERQANGLAATVLWDQVLAADLNEVERSSALADAALAALEAQDLPKAEARARDLLAHSNRSTGPDGNAIHYSNIVLGRVALRRNQLDAAKQYLLAAGRTPGSPNLDSFGPNMMLAKELLAKGERESVLQYFQLCGMFWESGADDLKQWTADVNIGKMPDFGRNLNY